MTIAPANVRYIISILIPRNLSGKHLQRWVWLNLIEIFLFLSNTRLSFERPLVLPLPTVCSTCYFELLLVHVLHSLGQRYNISLKLPNVSVYFFCVSNVNDHFALAGFRWSALGFRVVRPGRTTLPPRPPFYTHRGCTSSTTHLMWSEEPVILSDTDKHEAPRLMSFSRGAAGRHKNYLLFNIKSSPCFR